MDFKKKCVNFKKNAKEFGYDLKLTHIQELLAKYEGYENRHALLSQLKSTKNEKKQKWYYFDVHVFYGRNEGYSKAIRSKKDWKVAGEVDQEGMIDWLEEKNLIDKGDISCIDYIAEISEQDWIQMSGYNLNRISCKHCDQFYDKSDIQKTDIERTDVVCKGCYENEVKAYISTDDNTFSNVETYLSNEYLKWSIENEGMIEILLEGFYGPDYHTDNILYNAKTPDSDRILEYLDTINKVRKGDDLIGYSITVDRDSFLKWVKRNKKFLKKHGYSDF